MIFSHVLFRAVAVPLLSAAAFAAPFTQVIVYGDSLSDNGNTFTASGGAYPIGLTTMGRQSSGPVAVEYLAGTLGVALNDRAWAGATTGEGNTWDGGSVYTRVGLPGMMAVLETDLLAGLAVDPDALYVIWGGPNDMLAITDPTGVPAVISQAVTNLVTMTALLQAHGARHILVPGMPDLSLTPRIQFLDTIQPGTAALLQFTSLQFNMSLAAALPSGAKYFDTNSVFLNVYSRPDAYGLTNVSTPCVTGSTACPNPSEYLFWDDLHPTSRAHEILAEGLYSAAVPEPSTWIMLSTSFVILAIPAARRRPHSGMRGASATGLATGIGLRLAHRVAGPDCPPQSCPQSN